MINNSRADAQTGSTLIQIIWGAIIYLFSYIGFRV